MHWDNGMSPVIVALRTILPCIALAAVLGGCHGTSGSGSNDVGGSAVASFRLVEESEILLAEDMAIGNAMLWSRDTILAWSPITSGLFMLGNGVSRRRIGAGVLLPVGATRIEQDGQPMLEVIDAHGSTRAVIDPTTGEIIHKEQVKVDGHLLAANPVPGGWLLTGMISDTIPFLSIYLNGKTTRLALPPVARSSSLTPPLLVGMSGHSLMVAESRPPFRIFRHTGRSDPDAETWRLYAQPPNASEWTTDNDTSAYWVNLSVIETASELLQVLGDVKGDRRVILRYSNDGNLLVSNQFTTPISILDIDRGQRRVLAWRGLPSPRLILYRID